MSSSSSPVRTRGRVLRAGSPTPAANDLLALDLGRGTGRFDPRRVEEAVADGHAAGFAAGYDAGWASGMEASIAAAEAEQLAATRALIARLTSVVAAAERGIQDALSGVSAIADATAKVTSAAAFSVAEAIVGRELVLATDPGRDAVARALAISPEGADLTLRLHPDDAAALEAGAVPASSAITIVPDPSIAVGDCVIDAGWTRVDARISSALERVRAVLEGQ